MGLLVGKPRSRHHPHHPHHTFIPKHLTPAVQAFLASLDGLPPPVDDGGSFGSGTAEDDATSANEVLQRSDGPTTSNALEEASISSPQVRPVTPEPASRLSKLYPEIIDITSRAGRKIKHYMILELQQARNNLGDDRGALAVSYENKIIRGGCIF